MNENNGVLPSKEELEKLRLRAEIDKIKAEATKAEYEANQLTKSWYRQVTANSILTVAAPAIVTVLGLSLGYWLGGKDFFDAQIKNLEAQKTTLEYKKEKLQDSIVAFSARRDSLAVANDTLRLALDSVKREKADLATEIGKQKYTIARLSHVVDSIRTSYARYLSRSRDQASENSRKAGITEDEKRIWQRKATTLDSLITANKIEESQKRRLESRMLREWELQALVQAKQTGQLHILDVDIKNYMGSPRIDVRAFVPRDGNVLLSIYVNGRKIDCVQNIKHVLSGEERIIHVDCAPISSSVTDFILVLQLDSLSTAKAIPWQKLR